MQSCLPPLFGPNVIWCDLPVGLWFAGLTHVYPPTNWLREACFYYYVGELITLGEKMLSGWGGVKNTA
jgi:hypothetical protein